jgi:hypothetical protein
MTSLKPKLFIPFIRDEDLNQTEIVKRATTAAHEHAGLATACYWYGVHGDPYPLFLMNMAKQAVEYVRWWCDDNPKKYLRLYIDVRDDAYEIFLAPRPEYIVPPLLPIRFSSEIMDTIRKFEKHGIQLPSTVARLGFVDMADFNGNRIDKDQITWIGPMTVGGRKEVELLKTSSAELFKGNTNG